MNPRLSKSRFQKGLQCPKALWLEVHKRDAADPITESQQWVFDQGTEVGRLAHGLFDGGVEVTEDHRHPDEAVSTTARLLAEGVPVLFEPAFCHDGVMVRVDALVSVGDGQWDLYEVKSSTRLKPEHITDAAVQVYVAECSGLSVRRAHIVHIDNTYVFEGGDYDLSRLFAIEDVTADARAFVPAVPALLEAFDAMLAGPEPEVRIGGRCTSPYGCQFAGYCHAFLPSRHPVTDIPRLSEAKLHALLDAGITGIGDIPDDFGLLTTLQWRAVRAVKSGDAYVDQAGLVRDIGRLHWPVVHLDFETVNPALPVWAGTRPYQAVPFQYSIHVHHEDGTHEHLGYLHTGVDDPRPAIASRMLADLGERGSVLHYSSYEVRVLRELAEELPEFAEAIAAVMDRLCDLEKVVGANTRHPDACGRTSIKYVLPAWCPDMTYAGLGIQDGQTASVRYLKAVKGLVPEHEARTVFSDLVEYCGLDTFAMVRLLEALRTVSS